MQVSVENIGSLERKVHVEVPESRVTSEVSERLQNMTKTTKVEGFRPGKVPLKVINGRYGEQVRKEVVGELVRTTLFEAINQENLKPAGQPQIEKVDVADGKALSYTASFEIYPEITLKPIEKLKFEKPLCEVSKDDVDIVIEKLRKQHGELKIVERAVKKGDTVNIDFEGFIDNKIFEGGKAENYDLEIGTKSFIDGFEDGLIGKSKGEEVLLKLKFPKDYGKEELKGKQVEFKVKINNVNETHLPNIDKDFIKKLGIQKGDKESLWAEIKNNMEREVELSLRRQLKDMVLDKLYSENKIELPQSLVANERERLLGELEKNIKQQGADLEKIKSASETLIAEQAKKRVSLQLILAEIIKQNDLKADPKKVRQMVEHAASGYEDPKAVINWYYSDKKNLAEVEVLSLEDNVVDWVLEHANVTDKPSTFDEIMNKGQTAS
jgi:trigger factor